MRVVREATAGRQTVGGIARCRRRSRSFGDVSIRPRVFGRTKEESRDRGEFAFVRLVYARSIEALETFSFSFLFPSFVLLPFQREKREEKERGFFVRRCFGMRSSHRSWGVLDRRDFRAKTWTYLLFSRTGDFRSVVLADFPVASRRSVETATTAASLSTQIDNASRSPSPPIYVLPIFSRPNENAFYPSSRLSESHPSTDELGESFAESFSDFSRLYRFRKHFRIRSNRVFVV